MTTSKETHHLELSSRHAKRLRLSEDNLMEMHVPSLDAIKEVLEASSSSTHPVGPAARVAVAALNAAVVAMEDYLLQQENLSGIADEKLPLSSTQRVMPSQHDNDTVGPAVDQSLLLLNGEVLGPLITRGFLSSRDLGNLLFNTSKRLSELIVTTTCCSIVTPTRTQQQETSWGQHPFLWKLLFENTWGQSAKSAAFLLACQERGVTQEMCCRHFCLASPNCWPFSTTTMDPPVFAPADYFAVVEIRKSDTNEVICLEHIPGSTLTQFFFNGEQIVPIQDTFLLAKYSIPEIQELMPDGVQVEFDWDEDGASFEDNDWETILFDSMEFKYDVHAYLMRCPDRKKLNLFHDIQVHPAVVGCDIVHTNTNNAATNADFQHIVRLSTAYSCWEEIPSLADHSAMSSLLDSALEPTRISTQVNPDIQLRVSTPRPGGGAGGGVSCEFIVAGVHFETTSILSDADGTLEQPPDPSHTNIHYSHFLEAMECWESY